MQSLRSIDPRILGLERVYNGGHGFDHVPQDNLRVNRIYTRLVDNAARLGLAPHFILDPLMGEIRQGVRYGFGDDSLIVATAVARLATQHLCDRFLRHNRPLALRLIRMRVGRVARSLAEQRLRDRAVLPLFESPPMLVEPSADQVADAKRDVADLLRIWGNQKPWVRKRRRRRNRNRRHGMS